MPAFNDPARRSGAAKSKEEAGQARETARGCVGDLAGRVRADGHETNYTGAAACVQAVCAEWDQWRFVGVTVPRHRLALATLGG
jgi:hypothetical protein